MRFAIQVPGGTLEWLENGEAHRAIRRETGRQDIRILLPGAMCNNWNGAAATVKEYYNLGPREIVVETENGSVSEIVAGICRAWASAGEHPIERVREFISCLPVSVMLA